MTPRAVLPPIGGFILTGQLSSRQAAHAPVILRHDLTTDFFGIEERAASWLEFRSLQVFPISEAALARLRELLDDDPRFEIDTGHSGFGWIARPKVPVPHLMGLPVKQPPSFVTSDEQNGFRASQPAEYLTPIPAPRASERADMSLEERADLEAVMWEMVNGNAAAEAQFNALLAKYRL